MCDHPYEYLDFHEHRPTVCTKCGLELTDQEIREKEQRVNAELREIDSEIAAGFAKKAAALRKRDLFARRSCTTCGGPISYRPETVPVGRGRPREVCDNCKEQKAKGRQARYWANHPNKKRTRSKRSPKRSSSPWPEDLGGIPTKKERELLATL